MAVFRKARSGVPARYFAWEAAGLRWLADAVAAGGAPVVEVLGVDADHLDLVRLEPARPSPDAAAAFGRALAVTHRAGAAAYGVGPPGWAGDGYFGPLEQPLLLRLHPCDTWADHVAHNLIGPVTKALRDRRLVDAEGARLLEAAASGLGRVDPGEPPARLHGDLWSGNVLWTDTGAVLIDPAAHGGSREADLAMLALFGAPHLDRIVAAYDEVAPLAPGWRERVEAHQLYPVAVHALLFGGGYVHQTLALARALAG